MKASTQKTNKMKILISGASGLVGKALSDALRSDGHTVGRLGRFVRPGGRAAAGAVNSSSDIRWDPTAAAIDADTLAAMEGADVVVNLTGAGIADGRWTPERKTLLRSSRIDSTRLLVDALARLEKKPGVFVVASAVGFYGNRGDEILTESSAPGSGFLASVAQEWEAESARAESRGIRTVILRFGVILSRDHEGATCRKCFGLFRFEQWVGAWARAASGYPNVALAARWRIGIVGAAIADERYSGAYNVVAPNPVRNVEFTRIRGSRSPPLQLPFSPRLPSHCVTCSVKWPMPSCSQASAPFPNAFSPQVTAFFFPELEPVLALFLARRGRAPHLPKRVMEVPV